ncbi:glycosyltransferase family 9 protein [Formosa sp. PL04]|uniref:glycosyltransferase family 9 protein n=1 Tax=Formosa sp. PL04 TaxID=3081755 RepID=UPI00298280BD|nr:glycosyltransferase family 9 protein [Formosa sp. PL04]MDW5288807.1 glycosyltransferase family 9 protein [Formosa sp. PL04]
MKILVIQQKMIGDVLTSSILFEILRKEYPNATLHYLINANTFSVVEHNPYIDNFIIFPKTAEKNTKALFKFAKDIQHHEFDIVIDVYSKLSSKIISYYTKGKTRISYHKWYSEWIYTETVKRSKKAKTSAGLAIENRIQLLTPLVKALPEFIKPKIYLTHPEIEQSKQFLESNGLNLNETVFMIGVLGSGDSKSYPLKYMAEVIDTIVEATKAQILFNYIPSQLSQAQQIFDACKPETKNYIFFNVYGKSLREFLGILHHCGAIIGNEGGAINMAKALNIKTFTIFSPWIDKETWSIFEDSTNNVSVHLKDYQPELYGAKHEKDLKKESLSLYKKFTPNYFKNVLINFLKPF